MVNVGIVSFWYAILIKTDPELYHHPGAFPDEEPAIVTHIEQLTELPMDEIVAKNARASEMTTYAVQLDKLGFHSKDMIAEHCQEEIVDEFDWMKYAHKLAFKKWLSRNE